MMNSGKLPLDFFTKAGVADQIELINGDALQILPGA